MSTYQKAKNQKNQKKTKIENMIEALAPLVSELDHVFDEYYHSKPTPHTYVRTCVTTF